MGPARQTLDRLDAPLRASLDETAERLVLTLATCSVLIARAPAA